MRLRRALALVAAALLLLGTAPSQAAAKPATVSGRVPGGAPKVAGQVVSTVAAVNPATARYLSSKPLAPGGRYSFRVPPGPLLVLARVLPRTGKPKVSSSRIAKVRSGQRKRVKVTKKRPRARRRRTAHAGQGITVDLVKVSTFGSTVSNGVPGTDARALDGMMVTDVWQAAQRAPCDVEVYVDRDSPDFRAIEAEIALQNSPAFDPSTRVVPRYNDPRYQPTARIQAHLTLGPDGDTVTGQVVARERNGNTHARSVNGTWGRFFFENGPSGFSRALDDIFKELCGAGLSEISGSFSGSASLGGRANFTWNGGVGFKRVVENIPGAFGAYFVSSGLVTYTVSGMSPSADCQISGTQQINLPPTSGSINVNGSPPDGLEPYTYSISVPPPYPGTMEGTRSGCSDSTAEGTRETIMLPASPLDTGQSQQVSEDGITYKGSYTGDSGAQYDWALEGH
jgi:hypothetical protein